MIYLITWFLAGCQLHPRTKRINAEMPLPSFTLISLDSSRLTTSSQIGEGAPIIFMYFSPDCEHCQRMTKLLTRRLNGHGAVRLYMVTNESVEETKRFVVTFHLDTLSNVLVARDYNFSFFDSFLPSSVPFFAICDQQKKLKKIYEGEVDINSIMICVNQ
jgi:thiol-disulfide isomerase/thioredoxin